MNNEMRKFDDYIIWNKNIKELLIEKGFEVLGTIKSKKEKNSLGYKFKKSREFFTILNEIKDSLSQETKDKKFEEMVEKFKIESQEKVTELNKRIERY